MKCSISFEIHSVVVKPSIQETFCSSICPYPNLLVDWTSVLQRVLIVGLGRGLSSREIFWWGNFWFLSLTKSIHPVQCFSPFNIVHNTKVSIITRSLKWNYLWWIEAYFVELHSFNPRLQIFYIVSLWFRSNLMQRKTPYSTVSYLI
jgi:hypothetical protein